MQNKHFNMAEQRERERVGESERERQRARESEGVALSGINLLILRARISIFAIGLFSMDLSSFYSPAAALAMFMLLISELTSHTAYVECLQEQR